jgi:hypothetical protein
VDEFLETHRTVLSGDARDALLDALKGEFMPALSGEGDEVGHRGGLWRRSSATTRTVLSTPWFGRSWRSCGKN